MHGRCKNCSFWKCELKPSEHACKILFNYSKLCVISFSAKEVQFSPPKHASNENTFQTNSRNIIGRNPSMVIPLLANQDLTPMLSRAWLQLSHTHSKKLHLEPPLLKFLTITPDYYNYIVFTKNYQLDLCNKT